MRRCDSVLGDDEWLALARYRRPQDRHAALVSRALVRCLLSRYTAVEPSRWRFRKNRHGRPEIAEPGAGRALRFSLAHTAGMIAVLISEQRDLGVDVESRAGVGPYMAVAADFFSPAEAASLRSLEPAQRASRFLQYWTLKESYLKARGVGLSQPLDQVSFAIEDLPGQGLEIRPSFARPDDPRRWQFGLEDLGRGYILATAIERRRDERVRLLRREARPGAWLELKDLRS